MKNALILHGIQGHAGIHWQQWLHDGLIKKGYKVLMPDLPNSDHPDRDMWLRIAKKFVKDIDFSGLLIVGHSLGVVTALDLIESGNKKVKCLVSVAGFAKGYEAEINSYFLKEKQIDLNKVRDLVSKAVVIYGDNDPYVPQEILKGLADGLGVESLIIKNGGHINTDSGYTKLPLILELLEEK